MGLIYCIFCCVKISVDILLSIGSVRSSRQHEMDSLASRTSQVVTPQRQICMPIEWSNDQPTVPIASDVNRNMHRYNGAEFMAGSGQWDFTAAVSNQMFGAGESLPLNGSDSVGTVVRMSDDDCHTCSPDSAYHSSHDSGSSSAWNNRQGFSSQLSHRQWLSQVTQDPVHSKSHEKYPSWPVTQPSVLPPAVNDRTSSWTDNTRSRSNNTEFHGQKPLAVNSQVEDTSPPSPHTAIRYFEELGARLREQQSRSEFQTRNARFQPNMSIVGNQNCAENNFSNYVSPDYSKTVAGRASFTHSPGALECSPAPPPLPSTSPPHEPPPRLSSSGTTLSASSTGAEKVTTPHNAALCRDVFDVEGDRQMLTPDGRGMLGIRAVPNIRQAESFPEISINGVREQNHLVNTRRCIYENGSGSVMPLVVEGSHIKDKLSPRAIIEEDDLNSRLDQLPRSQSQTSVLRRLSQEYFGDSRSRYGINPSGRMSLGSISGSSSTSGNDLSHLALVKNLDTNYQCQESESPKETAGLSIFRAVEPPDDASTNFVRTRKTQMSLRKAFGIYDDFDAVEMELLNHLPVLAEVDVPSTTVPSSVLNESVELAACENQSVNWSKGRRSSESGFLRQAGDSWNVDRQVEKPSINSSSVLQRSISMGSGAQPTVFTLLHGHRLSTASDAQSVHSSSSGSTNGVRSSQDLLIGNSACATDVLPVGGQLVTESSDPLKAARAKSKSLPHDALLPHDADLLMSFPQQRHRNCGIERLEVNHACFTTEFLYLLILLFLV